MTFEEICKLDPMVLALFQEAGASRVLFDDGRVGRTFSAERAAKLRPDPNFCRTQLWYAPKRERGEQGLKEQLQQRVGWGAWGPGAKSELKNSEAWDICSSKILDAIPTCQHAPDKIIDCGDGVQVAESQCRYSYPVPPGGPGALERKEEDTAGFTNVIDQLNHAGGVGPEPTPIDLTPIDDLAEPVFIVQSEDDAKQLALNLDIVVRWKKHTISTWYARNAILVADAAACKKIIKANLKKENVVGGMGWKPIVLTFSNARLMAKLSEIGLAVSETEGLPESLEIFRNTVGLLSPESNLSLPDMPEAALDGWLGEVCRNRMGDFPRAFAWPALLAVAGALVEEGPIRTNLFVGLIGEVGSGKTSALRRAIWLLGMGAPELIEQKIGSGEGLAVRIGNAGNAARLWFPDELGHTMAKAQIKNATFPETLTTAWSTNQNDATIARQELVEFSCRLSIAGGLVTDRFGDAFGSASTGGLWDRFIFGECPSGFAYAWRPDEGHPERMAARIDDEDELRPPSIRLESVDTDVWAERDRWTKDEGINRRVAENALRVAAICAAFDGRRTLRAADLGPTLEFARYQEQMRGLHKPNPGKNESGIVYHRLADYLERHSPDEQWLEKRRVLQNTHAYDFGPGVADRVLDSMETSGQIERKKQGRRLLIRKRI